MALLTPILFPSPDCSFTCHYRCRALVRLDCSGPPGSGDENDGTEQALEKDTNVVGPGLCLRGRVGVGVGRCGVCLGWGVAMPGCATLCCVRPCCVTAGCTTPCCAKLCRAGLCQALLGSAVSGCAMTDCTKPCCAMLGCVELGWVMLCFATPCRAERC